jgi:hypothetical protein
MASNSIKIHEWTARLERYRRSGKSLTKFCNDEQVSIPSLYYWRDRLASIRIENDTTASQKPASSSTPSQTSLRFVIHAGNLKIECHADSMDAIDAVLAWASRNQSSNFQQVIVQG